MKPFIFNENEYLELNSLGLAFIENFDLALESIKEKNFIKFINHFKEYKNKIKTILFESYYLQNALSLIIYNITDEHILYVGHKRYNDIYEILKDINLNTSFKFFAFDKGFSNTLLKDIEDEKLKNDLVCFEKNHLDDFCIIYLNKYNNNDSIEPISNRINLINEAEDKYLKALETFKDENILLSMANHYSLENVLELRKRKCPVFKGIEITKDVLNISLLDNTFYHSLLSNYKKFKYKGKEAKKYKNEVKIINKKFKKYNKLSDIEKINLEEELYNLYLNLIDLYRLEKIIIKNDIYKPIIPYADTYICEDDKNKNNLIECDEKPYESNYKYNYNLTSFDKSFKNHYYFSVWTIIFIILTTIIYFCFGLSTNIRDIVANLFDKEYQFVDLPKTTNILYFVGLIIAFISSILILILRSIEKRKYKKLCKLSYYKNQNINLNDEQRIEYDELKENEEKYAKSIDKFYRFYGGIGLFGLSLSFVINCLTLIYCFGYVIDIEFSNNIMILLNDKLIFIFIIPIINLLLSLLRHKKTAWSVWFCFFISLILSICLIFI